MSARLFALFVPCILLVGCSTPQSTDLFGTILCWLRPSCLPSQPQTPTKPAISKPSPVSPKQKQTQKSLPKNAKNKNQPPKSSNGPPPCLASTETTTAVSLSVKRISYKEPTTQADGETLTDLKMTSIYFQPGNDPKVRILKRVCGATNPQGGGMVPEGEGTIQVIISEKIGADTKICVTATDKVGNEGESICGPIRE